jgi:hypothetical protein
VSANQLPSGATSQVNGVTLTAICKDTNNNAVQGAQVGFAAQPSGLLEVTQATTDASGTALAVLTTGGDPTNQLITVSATSGSVNVSLPVVEQGTNVRISGPNVVGASATANYTVTLADSSGKGIPNNAITLSSSLSNGISPASASTDINGQAVFTYTGTHGGTDNLTVSSTSLNASSSYAVAVSPTSLTFTAPTGNTPTVPFNTPTAIQIKYINNGAPVSGATLTFSTTRGTLTAAAPGCGAASQSGSSVTCKTDANGQTAGAISLSSDGSDGAGGVIVTAAVSGNGPSASLPLQFTATTPAFVTIQASPSTIAPSASSVVTAVVRDASENLVSGATVIFTLSDPTGGSLTAASGVTDQTGAVSVTYNATTTASAQNGVQVGARVDVAGGSSVTSSTPASITVGGKALRIALGTGNTISVLDQARYQMPYSVVVTDSAGNATFSLKLISAAYQKGHYYFDPVAGAWVQTGLVPSSDADFNKNVSKPFVYNPLDALSFGCITEDPQGTGTNNPTLIAKMDYNGNNVLDPGAVASVPSTVALDSTGSAQFFITYPKDHANWVEVLLTGTATVNGTESTAAAEFVLPVLSADITQKNVTPPGQISPYGDSANINDHVDPGANPNNCQSPN